MKLSDVKAKIDAYYDNLNPTDFIRHFESLGYEFEPIIDEYESIEVNFSSNIPNSPIYFPGSTFFSPQSGVFESLLEIYIECDAPLNTPTDNNSQAMAA